MSKEITIYQDELDYIERRHESFNFKIATAVEDAIQAGEALIDLKAKCKHGEFTNLVTGGTSLSMKTAQRYMNAYNNRLELLERGVDPEVIQKMSLTALVDLNRKPKAEPELSERFFELADKFNESHKEFVESCIAHNMKMLSLARDMTPEEAEEVELHVRYLMAKGEMSVFDDRFTHHRIVCELVRNAHLYDEADAATDPHWTAKVAFNARVAHHSFLYWFLQLDGEGLLCKCDFDDEGERIARNMTPAEIMDFARVELISGEMLAQFDADRYVSGAGSSDLVQPLSNEAMDAVNHLYDRGLLAA